MTHPTITAPKSPTKFERLAGQKARLYGSGYGPALESYYSRRIAEFNRKGDRENVRKAQAERAQMEALAHKTGVPAEMLDTLLKVQHERDVFPLNDQAKESRRQQTREALRLKHGDSAVRDQVLRDYVRATSVLALELPEFAARMDATGASLEQRNVEALAPLGARLREAAATGSQSPNPPKAA